MSLRSYLFLASLGLALALCVAFFQQTPGYMDASYYLAGGVWLVEGEAAVVASGLAAGPLFRLDG